MIFSLVQDFADALAAMPREHPRHRTLSLFDEAIRRDVHFLDRHSTTLFQCLWNTCWWYDCPAAARHYDPPETGWPPEGPPWLRSGPRLCALLESWHAARAWASPGLLWARSLRPPAVPLGSPQHMILQGHEDWVTSVACSADGRMIASAARDGTVRLWEMHNGQQRGCLHGHEGIVNCVACSPDGRLLASGGSDGTVRIWDAQGGLERLCLRGHKHSVWSVAFAPDSRRVASGGSDRTVRVWDVQGGQLLLCLSGHEGDVKGLAFSPDGRWLVSVAGTVQVWDVETGCPRTCLKGHQHSAEAVAFAPDGSRIVSAGHDGVRVWDFASGAERVRCGGHGGHPIRGVAFVGNGRRIVSGGWDWTVRLWCAESGREIACFRGHEEWVMAVACSPDGRLVSGGRDATVRVWDEAVQPRPARLRGNGHKTQSLAYSPNGRQVVSGGDDGTVRLWDAAAVEMLAGGKELVCLRGHTDRVSSVAFSPDGGRIVSGSADKTVRLWDANEGKELACLDGHRLGVLSVAFSRDGRRVLSWDVTGAPRQWDAETGASLTVAEREAGTPPAPAAGLPWQARCGPSEVVIAGGGPGQEVAWFSVPLGYDEVFTARTPPFLLDRANRDFLYPDPPGRTWVVRAFRDQLCFFRLERGQVPAEDLPGPGTRFGQLLAEARPLLGTQEVAAVDRLLGSAVADRTVLANVEGVYLLRLGRVEEALAQFRRLASGEPAGLQGPLVVRTNYATALLLLGDVEGCVAILAAARARRETSETCVRLESCLRAWRGSLPWWKKLTLKFLPARQPVPLDFPPGEIVAG
jgi:WD40 repeat protein